MRLSDLSALLSPGTEPPAGAEAVEVTGVSHNASWVVPGDAYVAIRGARADGHSFIGEAAARGAAAVIGERPAMPGAAAPALPYLTVAHAREALADAAAELAGHPSRRLRVVGVTGTDGKTTTSWLTRHLCRAAGLATGLLSTVGYELPDGELRHFPAHFTTPEAPQVQGVLAEMVAAGGQVAVLEASSHALALDRVRAVDWDVATWTHLTREHLDFHGSVESYFEAKARLVRRSPFAVLNADDPWSERLTGMAPQEWTYSAEGGTVAGREADWRATGVAEEPGGLRFTVHSPLGSFDAALPMIGRFNVANAMAAMTAAARLGASPETIVAGLASFPGVPGRMQLVSRDRGDGAGAGEHEGDPRVIVDFAHTPPSLEKALATVRTTTAGDLWVVLGSAGGPRDPSKRAPLGEVATRLADHTVFTEEDHRDTPLADILTEMARGAGERTNHVSIGDRTEAIRHAVGRAGPQDTILLAGKGPEETMERDTETVPWDEVEQARQALALRG